MLLTADEPDTNTKPSPGMSKFLEVRNEALGWTNPMAVLIEGTENYKVQFESFGPDQPCKENAHFHCACNSVSPTLRPHALTSLYCNLQQVFAAPHCLRHALAKGTGNAMVVILLPDN
jgi:hypothetical protein